MPIHLELPEPAKSCAAQSPSQYVERSDSGRQRFPIVVLGIGILHSGQNFDNLEITVPEGRFPQILHEEFIGLVVGLAIQPKQVRQL